MIVNDLFTALSSLIHLDKADKVVVTINNSAIVINFNTTSKLLGKKSQSVIALTFFTEIVDKELLKYEVENIRWRYMIDEHGKQYIFQSRRKGPFLEK